MENTLYPSSRTKSLTAEEAQKRFRNDGLNINSWALEQGFTPALVYAVLQGRRKCLRGQSHQIAVALGLKSQN
jgi:gp16 family phage-associated protein